MCTDLRKEEVEGAKGTYLIPIQRLNKFLLIVNNPTHVSGLDMLCMDKTGTLTLNRMYIQVSLVLSLNSLIPFELICDMQEDCPTFTPGECRETILFQVQPVPRIACSFQQRDFMTSCVIIIYNRYYMIKYVVYDTI